MKKQHTWYIEPKNAHTNEVIARMHQSGDNRFEEDTLTDVLCSDDAHHNLWRIASFDQALFLWKSRYDLKFEIFAQQGKGQIRNVTNVLFRKERRSPKRRIKK